MKTLLKLSSDIAETWFSRWDDATEALEAICMDPEYWEDWEATDRDGETLTSKANRAYKHRYNQVQPDKMFTGYSNVCPECCEAQDVELLHPVFDDNQFHLIKKCNKCGTKFKSTFTYTHQDTVVLEA
jgi:hypothetical protein